MTDKFQFEPIIRLREPNEGVCIEVGEDPDLEGLVQLRTPDRESKLYYGEIRLTVSPNKARQLAEALISVANQLDAQYTK